MTINEQMAERIRDRIARHDRKRHGKLTFTVEWGRGETYSNRDLTYYGHDNYERSSVLAGRERRMWIGDFGPDTPENRAIAEATIAAAGATKFTTWMVGGTTHVPIEQVVSHIPDDTDY